MHCCFAKIQTISICSAGTAVARCASIEHSHSNYVVTFSAQLMHSSIQYENKIGNFSCAEWYFARLDVLLASNAHLIRIHLICKINLCHQSFEVFSSPVLSVVSMPPRCFGIFATYSVNKSSVVTRTLYRAFARRKWLRKKKWRARSKATFNRWSWGKNDMSTIRTTNVETKKKMVRHQ